MKKLSIFAVGILSLLLMSGTPDNVKGTYEYPFQNPSLSSTERTEDLISRLTIEEKVGMMMNRSVAVDRLGVPAYNWWGEACHGLMGVSDVTVFPQCIALAATFDDDAQLTTYTMVSDEARGRYNSLPRTGDIGPYVSALPNLTFWCPNVNIFRDPRWGRGQETYGEDPYLMSRMGLNVVKGMQGNDDKYYKTHACAKHYAVHSGPEPLRHKFNAVVSRRDLWETYLPAFKTLVTEGNVQEVMCAYSAYEGEPCCTSSRLLVQILRDRWNYQGLIVSDCDAINDFYNKGAHGTHENAMTASSDAVRNGTDLECGKSYQSLVKASQEGLIDEKELDVSLRRLIKARIELGMFDPDEMNPYSKIPGSVVDCQAHRDHALLLAREAQVLLKNNNVLPLSKNLKKIAVVGPNADDAEMMRGNYSGTPTHCITILQGIKAKMPNAQVEYIKGCEIENEYIQVPKMKKVIGTNGKPGLYSEYFASPDWTGNTVRTDNVTKIDFMTDGGYGFGEGVPSSDFTARYTGKFTSDFTGELCFAVRANNYKVLVNGEVVTERKPLSFKYTPGMQLTEAQQQELRANRGGGFGGFGFGFGRRNDPHANVEAGQTYDIEILYKSETEGTNSSLNVNMYERKIAEFSELKDEVKDYDAIIFVGGITSSQEGEGHERQTIELPAVQQRLLKALHETGKPVVFVNCSGSCVAFTEVENDYDALLQAWYPGQEGGTAVADVLFGDFNPSGKLPVTFYKSTDQLPDFQDYSMENRTYRYFKGEPLYSFGYGLSYTTFDFGTAKLSKSKIKAGKSVDITIPVTNSGKMNGAEVVQVYVKSLDNPDAPIKSLKAYKRIELGAGETQNVKLTLTPDAFSYYLDSKDDLAVFAGKYQILYGNSSRDADLKALNFEVK
ncbi:MAG: glycoside hydrolase family 3 C-terminal domain-containing protein [Bacteroidaceae bacterium]|nr:glycoside hydrolase family 3 C-terminal domain-containing protein [Bacteroidaceae bacterium]